MELLLADDVGLVVGDAALILRCREQKTEAAFSTKDTYLGDKPVTMRFRINSEDPIKEIWRPSVDGRAAFAPKPEDFIRALPDSGRVFINSLRKNLGIGALAVFLPRVLGRSGCCEQTLT